MNALARRIARMIHTDGPLSLASFMTIALHDREAGFYAARESIGASGAFITAPEISQIFGELLGLWCAKVWQDQDRPQAKRLIELGPGRGTLTSDALRALSRVPDFLSGLEITLVEASPALEAIQRYRLRDLPVPIRWVRQWDEVGLDRPLFLLANEFLDALPIRQFVMTNRGWCERMVVADADFSLAFALAPVPSLLGVPAERGIAETGAVYEISPATEALVEDVAWSIGQRGGAALFIDYGHTGKAFGDTLQAVAGHEHTRILEIPGETDLSAHVDFAAVARSAKKGGACVHGPLAQGAFLRALGLDARAEHLCAANPERRCEIEAAMQRLTGTQAMGELFKAAAIRPAHAPRLPGF